MEGSGQMGERRMVLLGSEEGKRKEGMLGGMDCWGIEHAKNCEDGLEHGRCEGHVKIG